MLTPGKCKMNVFKMRINHE
uniref:Uncharacterized protein n=1 Tax=Anguilla anguilla TaxID=7936 RepID=A0A0E9UDB4_ANGAN